MQTQRKARPARIRIRLWDTPAAGAIPLDLPARKTWPVAIAFGIFFLIFAGVGYGAVATVFGRPVNDLFDLAFRSNTRNLRIVRRHLDKPRWVEFAPGVKQLDDPPPPERLRLPQVPARRPGAG